MKLSVLACFILGLLISCGGLGLAESLTGKYAHIIVSNNSAYDVIIALDDGSLDSEDNGNKNDQRVLLVAGDSKVWNLIVTDDARKVWLKLPSYGVQELELEAGETRSFIAGRHKIYDAVRVIFHNNDAKAHAVDVTPLENGGLLRQDGEFSTSETKNYIVDARGDGRSGRKYLYFLLTEPKATFRLSGGDFGNVENPTYLEVGSGALNDREVVFQSGTVAETPYVFYTKTSCILSLEMQKPADMAKMVYQFLPNNVPKKKQSGEVFADTAKKEIRIEEYLDRIKYRIRVDLYANLTDSAPSRSYIERNIECKPDTTQLNYLFSGDEIQPII